MSTGLGVRIGTVTSVAVLDTDRNPHAPRDFATDEAMPTVTRRTALDLRPGAAPSLAAHGERYGRHLLGGFANRVGDPVPLIDDEGRSHLAENLYATATRALVAEVSAGTDCEPTVVVTHPDRWTSHTADTLREALERAGVSDATLVPESVATMRWLEGSRGKSSDGLTVIYDLGATSLDITLVATGSEARTIGSGAHSTDFGGSQFDHSITQYVLDTISNSTSFEFDAYDPDTVGALVELRARCGEAKERLSSETATTLSIDLPGMHTEARLVRDEVEDLVRAPILGSIGLIRETLSTAGFADSDVTQVVLIGGSSGIPLVAELISSELRVPVVTGPSPDRISAIGGAILANEFARTAAADAPAPAAPAMPRLAPSSGVAAAAESSGISGRKKAGIVFASVAALAVIAGGGLSLGTSLTSDSSPAETVSENNVDTTNTTAAPVVTVADGTTAGGSRLPTPIVAADGTLIPAPGTVIAPDGTVVADPNFAVAPNVVDAVPPAAANPAVPNAPVPNVSIPRPQAPVFVPPPAYVPPAYTPPAYTAPTYNGPTLNDLGNGVGDVGQELGKVPGGLLDLVPIG